MKHRLTLTILALLASAAATAAVPDTSTPGTGPSVAEIPAIDLRSSDLELVRARASQASRAGVVVILYGNDAEADRAVREATREAAAAGIAVKSIFLASADTAGNGGVAVYGVEGAQYGAVLPVTATLKSDLLVRIQKWRSENHKIASDGGVQHCRMMPVTGSRVRREKVCTNAAEDKEREQSSKDFWRNQQNHGGNEAIPTGG